MPADLIRMPGVDMQLGGKQPIKPLVQRIDSGVDGIDISPPPKQEVSPLDETCAIETDTNDDGTSSDASAWLSDGDDDDRSVTQDLSAASGDEEQSAETTCWTRVRNTSFTLTVNNILGSGETQSAETGGNLLWLEHGFDDVIATKQGDPVWIYRLSPPRALAFCLDTVHRSVEEIATDFLPFLKQHEHVYLTAEYRAGSGVVQSISSSKTNSERVM